jgi:hypothetical protein
MSNANLAPVVRILVDRSADILAQAGLTAEDFVGVTGDKAREIIADCKSAMGMTDDAALGQPPKTGATTNQGNADSVETTEYMGLAVERRVYGQGTKDRRVYMNAKAFDGSAYLNISLPMGDKQLKLGGINLQDLSESNANDNGTRRGRATLLRLLQEHGLTNCGKIEFTVELNVQALAEDNHEEFDAAIAGFFQTATTK